MCCELVVLLFIFILKYNSDGYGATSHKMLLAVVAFEEVSLNERSVCTEFLPSQRSVSSIELQWMSKYKEAKSLFVISESVICSFLLFVGGGVATEDRLKDELSFRSF